MFVDLKKQYRASLKSMDTEEGIDLAFYRPLGFAWAYLFRRIGITPNAVTIASIFLGLGAGVCFFFNDLWINIIGIFLLIWANTFDSCDGQLARLTGNYSPLGRILDGLSGDIWFFAIYAAICLREDVFSPWFSAHPLVIWILAAVTGVAHGKQAAMADYYRQFHLFFVNGRSGSELDRAGELRRRWAAMPWRGNLWRKLTLYFYTQYTVNQEAWTPSMQRLRTTIARHWPEGNYPPQFVADFRKMSLPLMKYTNILTFNWRSIVLFITILAGQPWLYFVFELVVLTALLVYMMLRHERMCRILIQRIDSGDYATPPTTEN